MESTGADGTPSVGGDRTGDRAPNNSIVALVSIFARSLQPAAGRCSNCRAGHFGWLGRGDGADDRLLKRSTRGIGTGDSDALRRRAKTAIHWKDDPNWSA